MTGPFLPFNSINSEPPSFLSSPVSSSLLQEENILHDTDEWISDDRPNQERFQSNTPSEDFVKMEIEQDELDYDKGSKETGYINGAPSDRTTQFKENFKPDEISLSLVSDVESFIKKYDLLSDDPKRFLNALSLNPSLKKPHQSLFRFLSYVWLNSGQGSSFNIWKMEWFLEILCLALFEDKIGYIPERHLTKVLDFLSRKPWVFWKDSVTVLSVQRQLVPILRVLCEKEILSLILELIQHMDQKDLFKVSHKDLEGTAPFKRFQHPEFVAYWTLDNQYKRSPFLLLNQKIIKINKINANIEDIFFALKDFINFQEKYVIIWEKGISSGNNENINQYLNLCNPDSWHWFLANLTEFFCFRHLTPLYEQIYNCKISQDITLMKISFSLDRNYRLVSRKIQKLSKKHLGSSSKRQYRKKAKYWKDRKNPIVQEMVEYSKELMISQKKNSPVHKN